jgi:hypothetical protein
MTAAGDGELVGRQLGDYVLEGLLGRGGMAEVYRARELALGRAVAVKVLPAGLALDQGYVERFREEAQRVAALQLPHIVPVYYYSEHDPLLYLVMPILTESLRDRLLREERLDPLQALRIASEVAAALQAAHAQGIVHRDVKPENILLDATGAALLTDFGIARDVSLARQGGAQTLSGIGLPVGTPEYMAPEQLRSESVDGRADIYALGAVLYELLTGRAPHEAGTPYEVAALVLTMPISPPSRYNPVIWLALEQAIMIALAAKPDDRFASAAEFAAALTRAGELAGTEELLTGAAGTRSYATRRLTRLTRLMHPLDLPQTPDEIAEAVTVPVITVVRPGVSQRLLASLRRQRVMLAASLVALLLVAILGGGSLIIVTSPQWAARSPQPTTPTGASAGGIPKATVTAISAALATAIAQHTPGAAETATAAVATAAAAARPTATTATPPPTQTPQPTATPVPGAPLRLSPMPLVLVPTQGNPKTCLGTQTITNTATQVVGWAWQNPITQGGLHFQLNGKQVSAPPTQTSIAPSAQDMLTVTSDCKPQPQSSAVLVKDTLGNSYTFELTVQ